MATLVPLTAIAPDLIEQLLDRAFGLDRHARTAYRIRVGTNWLPALSFAVLDEDDYLTGSIQLWPIALTDKSGSAYPMLMVGPVAVVPERQGEGFGKALISASLSAIDPQAALPQVLIGDESYYGSWGFHARPTANWHTPGPNDPARLLVRHENTAILPDTGMLGPWTPDMDDPDHAALADRL